MPSHVCAEEGATALQTPADVAVGPVSQAESGGTPEPEKAEETADASAVSDRSDGSVTYTFNFVASSFSFDGKVRTIGARQEFPVSQRI